MIGYKQKRLIELGKESGIITLEVLRKMYPNKDYALSAMQGLEALGYFIEMMDPRFKVKYWKYIK